jgi:hypothetical protein
VSDAIKKDRTTEVMLTLLGRLPVVHEIPFASGVRSRAMASGYASFSSLLRAPLSSSSSTSTSVVWSVVRYGYASPPGGRSAMTEPRQINRPEPRRPFVDAARSDQELDPGLGRIHTARPPAPAPSPLMNA